MRTQDGHRVVIACGVVLAQYALGDHMAESYAMVNLVDQGLANQSDVARAFGCSTRTVRRHQRRFEGGGLAALDRSTLVDVREWRAQDGSWSRNSVSRDIPTVRSRGALELVRKPFESSCEVAETR